MKKEARFLLGVFVILAGILLLLEQASIITSFSRIVWDILSTFWPLVLIFLGTKLLLDKSYTPGIILFVLGVSFLSSNLFDWDFFAVIWPIILIALGMSMLFKKEQPEKRAEKRESKEDHISETVVFWALEKKITSKNLTGGELNVAFGDLELDLRDSEVNKKGAKIHLNCAFGDVDIFVPKNCRVKTSGSVVLGEWEPNVKDRKVEEPVLEITGSVLLGSVNVSD